MPTQLKTRILLNGTPLAPAIVDAIEEINVDQEMDLSWEARIKITAEASGGGHWTMDEETFQTPGSRLRVEVTIAGQSPVALLDGPVVGFETSMSAEPGKSFVTWIARDDCYYLDRDQEMRVFIGQSADQIARQLYQDANKITGVQLSVRDGGFREVTPSDDSVDAVFVQRGTKMAALRKLARMSGCHAYVLPSAQAGQSVACFLADASETDGLPPLVLGGLGRNLSEFELAMSGARPATTQAGGVGASDKDVRSSNADSSDESDLGTDWLLSQKMPLGERAELMSGLAEGPADLDTMAQGLARRLSYATEVKGSLDVDQYKAVLSPYRVVQINGVNQRLSGYHLIRRVSHVITRSTYTQKFVALRNAASSSPSTAAPASATGGIF